MRRIESESGFVLILVLGIASVLTVSLVAGLGIALNHQTQAARDGNWNGALSAAQAGVDDYVAHFNAETNYWTDSSTTNPVSPNYNAALVTWKPLGSTSSAYFRYTVLNQSTILNDGYVKLQSSGKVGTSIRTLVALIRPGTYIDFVYYSNYEEGDPAIPEYGISNPSVCDKYDYTATTLSASVRGSPCVNLNWVSADTINGDLHSQDGLFIQGTPTFNGKVSTACPNVKTTDPCYHQIWIDGGSGAPKFASTPVGSLSIPIPTSNTALKAAAQSGGCLYTGPTRIVLLASGNMSVSSPNTTATSACPLGTSVPLPANGVLFVQNIPAGTAAYTNATANHCTAPWVTNTTTTDSTSGGTKYPLAADVLTANYDCHDGDLWIEGTLKGQLTVATDDDTILTGNLLYANGLTGTDVLGVVAQNQIRIYHPVNSSGTELCANPCMQNPTFDGAFMSVAHSWNVMNYDKGVVKGTITLNGSIAQDFRGPVGTNSGGTIKTGYAKNYNYDPRLHYLSPPQFLQPNAAAWVPIQYSNVPPAYTS